MENSARQLRELRTKYNTGNECSGKQYDPKLTFPGKSSRSVRCVKDDDRPAESVRNTLGTKVHGGLDNGVKAPEYTSRQMDDARCEPGGGKSSTDNTLIAINTKASPVGDPSSDHGVALSYRAFLATLGHFFIPIFTGCVNFAMSPIFPWLLVVMALCTIHLTIGVDIKGIWGNFESVGSWTIEQGSAAVVSLGQGCTSVKDLVVRFGSTIKSNGVVFLCESPRFAGLGAFLGLFCLKPDDKQMFCRTLNDTTSTLVFWGEISEVILPHSSHFQLATGLLDRQKVALEYGNISFPTRELAIELLGNHTTHLSIASDKVSSVALETDSIFRMMVTHLLCIEDDLKQLVVSTRFWPPSKERQLKPLDKLLGRNLGSIEQLLHLLHQCAEAVALVQSDGNTLIGYLEIGIEHLEPQHQSYEPVKKDERIKALKLALKISLFVASEILDRLNVSLTRLKRHPQDLKVVREKMLRAERMSKQDVRDVLKVVRLSIEYLSGAADKVMQARDEEKARFEEQEKSGHLRTLNCGVISQEQD